MDLQTKVDITKSLKLVCNRANLLRQCIIDQKPITTQDIYRMLDDIFLTRNESTTAINNECSICMEESGCDHTLSCGHGFHRACISRWMEESNTCPYCRQPIMSDDHVQIIESVIDLEHNGGYTQYDLTRDSYNRLLSQSTSIGLVIAHQETTIHVRTIINLFEEKPQVSAYIDSIIYGDFEMDIPMNACSNEICVENMCKEMRVQDMRYDYSRSYHHLKDLIQYWMYGCA